MGGLRKLRKLQASFNRLKCLPESMGEMEALELFRAASNPDLKEVPPHLGKQTSKGLPVKCLAPIKV